MIKLKYNSYSQMPLKIYFQLREIIDDDSLDDMDKELSIISLLCDIPYDDLLEMNLNDIKGVANQLEFLNNFDVKPKGHIKHISINNIKYNVCTDISKFTVAQYVDFQMYTSKKTTENIAEVLSTFIIPDGKKYGEDYDIAETIENFKTYIDIQTAMTVQNFFTEKLAKYINNILLYLRTQILMMKMKMKNIKKKEMTTILNQLNQLQQTYGLLSQTWYQKQ